MDRDPILVALGREAEALSEVEKRFAQLSGGPRAPRHAELDALAAAIDDRIDACLRIWQLLSAAKPRERRASDAPALERLVRRLGVLRAQVLGTYLARADVRAR